MDPLSERLLSLQSDKAVYVSAPYSQPHPPSEEEEPSSDYFEDEVLKGLHKDDTTILEERYKHRTRNTTKKTYHSIPPSSSKAVRERQQREAKSVKSQTQWTRALDAVQEHFSSHVNLDGSLHKLPPSIYALKTIAKHNWVLYKKRECERRKRIRKKLEREKEKERTGKPANILMAMVDSCEVCKRLYVTVNLFWGVTLCDSCYFTPGVINDIMKTKKELADQKMSYTPENIVKEVIQYRKDFFAKNKNYFQVDEPEPSSSSFSVVITKKPIVISSPPTDAAVSSEKLIELEKVELAESIVSGQDNPFYEDDDSEGYTTSEETTPPPPSPPLPSSSQLLPSLPSDSQLFNGLESQSFVRDVMDYFDDDNPSARFSQHQRYGNSIYDFDKCSQLFGEGGYSQSNFPNENSLSFTYESTKASAPRK